MVSRFILLGLIGLAWISPAWSQSISGPSTVPSGTSISGTTTTATGGTTARTQANSAADFYNVISSGAVCDGTTDDTTALNAAFASGNKRITGPSAKCRATATITIPTGVTVDGLAANPGNAPTGFTIYCDATVTPCVNVGSGGNNGQTYVSKLIVSHAGTPASTTIGLQVNNGYNVTIVDTMSYNSGICWNWAANFTTGNGISGNMTRDYAGNCQDAMIQDSSWPELRITDGRYGMNGTNAYTANAYVRVTGGGTASGASAPNTVYIKGGQYNGGAIHFMEFTNLGGPVPGTDATDFKIYGTHIETVTGAYFYSDSTWNEIDKLSVVNNTMNSNSPCFALNAGTQPVQLIFTNNQSACSDVTLTGQTSQSLSSIIIDNNDLYGTGGTASIVLTGVAGSTVDVAHNSVANGINLSGTWGHLTVGPNTYVGGSFTDTSTGFGRTYFERTGVLLADSGSSQIPLELDGNVSGNFLEEEILNNNAVSGSQARTLWQTASSGVFASMGVTNGATPTASVLTGSGITGSLTIQTAASTSPVILRPNGNIALTASGTGVVANLQLTLASGSPTIASGACGTGTNGTITGSNQAGIITVGSASATTCVVGFSATLATAPAACSPSPANSAAISAGAYIPAPSTSGFTLTGAALANTAWNFHCF